MREIEFKMERQGQVKIGDAVEVIERSCPANYHYIIKPAVAMSGCFQGRERLKDLCGIVKDIKQTDRGFFVVIEFDE